MPPRSGTVVAQPPAPDAPLLFLADAIRMAQGVLNPPAGQPRPAATRRGGDAIVTISTLAVVVEATEPSRTSGTGGWVGGWVRLGAGGWRAATVLSGRGHTGPWMALEHGVPAVW